MKSLALLAIGILTGTAAGIYIAPRFQEPPTAVNTPSIVSEPKTTIASPFAPVPSPSIIEIDPTPAIIKPTVANNTHTAPTTSINKIEHYRQAIAYLQHIDTADSEELKNLLSQLDSTPMDSAYNRMIATALFQRFGEVDIDAALEHALAGMQNRNDGYSPWSHDGLITLAGLNPELVQQKIDQLDSSQLKSELQQALYAGVARKDPEQLTRQLISDGGNHFESPGLSMAISEWAMQDPAAAWDFLQNEADEQSRTMHAEQVLYMWSEKDPDAAFIEIEALLNSNAITEPENFYMLNELYISHLSKTDPTAAYQYAIAQQDPRMKESALMSVLYGWDDNDITGLENFVAQIGAEESEGFRSIAVSVLAEKKAYSNPSSAMKWAEQLPESESFEAKINIIGQWANTDPQAAADWLFNLPDTASNQELMGMAAINFLYNDPETAKQAFARMPPNLQANLTPEMITSLEPEKAQAWLNQQTNPEVQQIGATILNATNPNTNTNTALEQIAGLQNIRNRESILFDAVMRRYQSDRSGVAEWVANTSLLSDQEREILTSMTSQSGRFSLPSMPSFRQ